MLANKGLVEELPPLTAQEAAVESNRCLFCYDAPCTHACPTHIDIPRFIKKISTGNMAGSARAILEANLLGATCSRVCPVQELCEGACVLGSEHKPIAIGRLQRHAMDYFYAGGARLVSLAPSTGKRVAVVGAGPAGLSCAGELARMGHAVTVFSRRPSPAPWRVVGARSGKPDAHPLVERPDREVLENPFVRPSRRHAERHLLSANGHRHEELPKLTVRRALEGRHFR